MKKANLILSGICSMLAIYVIIAAMQFPPGSNGVPGTGVFPIIVASMMLASCISIAITSFRMKEDIEIPWLSDESKMVYISMVALVFYTIILAQVGFVVTSIIFLTCMIQWFKKGSPVVNSLISTFFVCLVYGVFSGVLNVPMNFGFLI